MLLFCDCAKNETVIIVIMCFDVNKWCFTQLKLFAIDNTSSLFLHLDTFWYKVPFKSVWNNYAPLAAWQNYLSVTVPYCFFSLRWCQKHKKKKRKKKEGIRWRRKEKMLKREENFFCTHTHIHTHTHTHRGRSTLHFIQSLLHITLCTALRFRPVSYTHLTLPTRRTV